LARAAERHAQETVTAPATRDVYVQYCGRIDTATIATSADAARLTARDAYRRYLIRGKP
jgi:hypothetical protein